MIIKEFASFNRNIKIDGFIYYIDPLNIDFSKMDYEGCSDYDNISYVVLEDGCDPRIRILKGVYDEDDRSKFPEFGSRRYKQSEVKAVLDNGDECYCDELYKIISHNNKFGEVYYDYLDKKIIHQDLID